ncbi:acyl-coenzyme A synthetase, partial [Aureobasidium melanogenum]
MFTAPTALRAIRREDGQHKFFIERGERDGLRSLRALFLAGERSEPAVVNDYTKLLQKYGAPGAAVVDNWWSSESGSPMTGLAQLPCSWHNGGKDKQIKPLETRPGSAGKPMPGFDIRVVDDDGNELPRGKTGNIVLGMPLAPTGFTTLWKDEKRFYNGYMLRFEGKWLDTGDAGIIDKDGYVHIHGRSDDMINVAAHRLSTATLEQAISSHPAITDNCVIPAPDPLKGHVPFAFVALSPSAGSIPESELLTAINSRVRAAVGPIATLGGVIVAQGVIPRTRSGKTLRRVLKQMVEDASEGHFDKEVEVPATIEDAEVVERARKAIKTYFTRKSKL